MKKFLALIGLMAVSTPMSLSVVACSNNSSAQVVTYKNINDGIKSLNLNSFENVNSTVDSFKNDLKVDILLGLIKLKFDNSVNFLKDLAKNNFSIKEIINTKTNKSLVDNDLKKAGILKLKVTVTCEGKDVQLNSSTLNINSGKTDQEISDYIKNYDFSSLFQNSNFSPFIGVSLDILKQNCLDIMGAALGSYSNYINGKSFSVTSIKNGNKDLTQSDLNTIGNLKLTIMYSYNKISATVNINVTLTKLDFNKIPNINDNIQVSGIKNPKSLTSTDVTLITSAINTYITNIVKPIFAVVVTSDFDIQGIENTVKVGTDFSKEKAVTFTVVAKHESNFFTGTTVQTLNVTVTK